MHIVGTSRRWHSVARRSGSPHSKFEGLATVNDEGFASVEAADVVRVDDVAVPGSLAAEAGVVEGVGLLSPLQDPLGNVLHGDHEPASGRPATLLKQYRLRPTA